MIHIDELTEELQIFTGPSETGLRTAFEPEPGMFIAESPKVILRALDAGYEPIRFLCDEDETGAEARETVRRLEETGCPMYSAKAGVLSAITGFKLTRGALCAMRRKTLPTLSEILENARVVAVLDNLENPSNVGAVIRSAAALGIDAVVLTEGSSDPLYRRALRVSMGTAFLIPWTFMTARQLSSAGARAGEPGRGTSPAQVGEPGRGTSPAQVGEPGRGTTPTQVGEPGRDTTPTQALNSAEVMKSYGYTTVAFALRHDSVDICDEVLKKADKLAIILGNEGDGLPEITIDSCDHVVKIPMREGVDSLNVAAASAVAFWELGDVHA